MRLRQRLVPPIARAGESEQGLPADTQAPPAGIDLPVVLTKLMGQETQGQAGEVHARRIAKQTKPLVETDFLVENPSSRGFV